MALLIAFEAISSEKNDEFGVGSEGEAGNVVVGKAELDVGIASTDVSGSVKFIKEYA